MSEERYREQRRQLARFARRKSCRIVGRPPERPSEWRPESVIDPETKQPFTPAGAWEFIADVLDNKPEIPLETVTLRRPQGRTAYVLKVPLQEKLLYIKLELGTNVVIGRSFHYSHYDVQP
jgi:hypothetical protein